ncbi:MAG TPA: HNH endonuclease signature motif containing protein [Candidatus Nanoarchaeia archaeon]|nr:HNH endonuclease signature motif containing protein [Candidatus Nanoarchaeia archaeon]
MDKEKSRARDKEYYHKNLEKIRARKRKQMREFRKNNKERVKEQKKKYYQKNKDKIKEQRKVYVKEYYQNNKEKIKEYGKKRWKEYYQKTKTIKREKLLKKQEFVLSYKKDKCCELCGYKEYPEILQFHHKNRKDKSFTIGRKYGKNLKLIKAEMDKCILLCPNCHSWLHFNEE